MPSITAFYERHASAPFHPSLLTATVLRDELPCEQLSNNPDLAVSGKKAHCNSGKFGSLFRQSRRGGHEHTKLFSCSGMRLQREMFFPTTIRRGVHGGEPRTIRMTTASASL